MASRIGGRPRDRDVAIPAQWRVLHRVRDGLRRRRLATHLEVSANAMKYHLPNIRA